MAQLVQYECCVTTGLGDAEIATNRVQPYQVHPSEQSFSGEIGERHGIVYSGIAVDDDVHKGRAYRGDRPGVTVTPRVGTDVVTVIMEA